MKSYSAIKRAVGPHVEAFAKRFRRSRQRIYQWMEPAEDYTDSGTINPVDRVELLVETAVSLGQPEADAMAPLDYLDNRFGRVAFTLPKDIGTPEHEAKELLQLMEESGDIVREHNKCAKDGRISKLDFAQVDREIWEAARQLMIYREALRRAVK